MEPTIHEDGDLLEFLERLEELSDCYRIPHSRLISTLPSILEGNALKWYILERFPHGGREIFLSKRHLSQLEHSFYNRGQYNRYKAKDFILQMLTSAKQHPTLRTMDHLERIYDGLHPEYRHYVRRSDFTTLDELISLTDDYELLKRNETCAERPHTSHMVSYPTDEYNRATHCRRCGKPRHRRFKRIKG